MSGITLKLAQNVLNQAVEHISESHEAPVAAVIVSPEGEPIALARMDGVPARIAFLAQAKGYTAAFREASTLSFKEFLAREGLSLNDFLNPRLTALPGGVPVKVNGLTVGAVGVSGRLPLEDHQLSTSIAEALQKELEA